ncbi:MAG: VIT and VWA domain-containing protein, partial [Phycisphaeraceae bacterium]|nr:VIT and VWA domain-containing protein [Phycisphaeraceae bacterium]
MAFGTLTVSMGLVLACSSSLKNRFTDQRAPQQPTHEAERQAKPGTDARHVRPDHRAAPDGSFPSVDEELWVIVRPEDGGLSQQPDRPAQPEGGVLVAAGRPHRVPATVGPEKTRVRARIDGFAASVDLTQRFVNPFDQTIDATYRFALPPNGAVSGFVLTLGRRKIRGILRERNEAEKLYASARRHGLTATLLVQQRPNFFTQKVARIEPGGKIDVSIRYFHTLRFVEGAFEFVFPMNGPLSDGPDAQQPEGAAEADPPKKPAPQGRGRVDLRVDLHGQVAADSIRSPTHRILIERPDTEQTVVRLKTARVIRNQPFLLRYRMSGDSPRAHLMIHRDGRSEEGTFALMLLPPADLQELEPTDLQMIFVLDCSRSMRGRPMQQARAALQEAFKKLRPADTFS